MIRDEAYLCRRNNEVPRKNEQREMRWMDIEDRKTINRYRGSILDGYNLANKKPPLEC